MNSLKKRKVEGGPEVIALQNIEAYHKAIVIKSVGLVQE